MPKRRWTAYGPTADSFFEDLHADAAALEQARQKARHPPPRQCEAWEIARDLARRAGFGTAEQPVVDARDECIEIDATVWAEWIVELAAAWQADPGPQAEIERALVHQGLGIRAARECFTRALAGRGVEAVAAVLDQAHQALPANRRDEDISVLDTQVGMAVYFQLLGQFLSEYGWCPPGFTASRDPYGEDAQVSERLTTAAATAKRIPSRGGARTRQRGNPGRPVSDTWAEDESRYDDWLDGSRSLPIRYASIEEFGNAHDLTARRAQQLIDCVRKRRKRKAAADGQTRSSP